MASGWRTAVRWQITMCVVKIPSGSSCQAAALLQVCQRPGTTLHEELGSQCEEYKLHADDAGRHNLSTDALSLSADQQGPPLEKHIIIIARPRGPP
jgi:hypothetical protein